jgi:ATP-dependent Clp protease ATP-binding subunit ClpC
MHINDYLKKSSLYNVIATESLLSEDFREKLTKISQVIITTLIFVLLFFYFTKDHPNFIKLKYFVDLYNLVNRVFGIILINIGIYIFSQLGSFYYASTYYFDKIAKNKYGKNDLYTFSAGRILYAGRKTDILHGFFDSRIGGFLFVRLGISDKDVKTFYNSQKINRDETIPKPEDEILTIQDIVKYLYSTKPDFVRFLNDRGITDKELLGAIDWIIYQIEITEYYSKWWRPEALSQIKSIADDWSFGRTFVLDKYSRNLLGDREVSSEAMLFSKRDAEINQIENALSKSTGSNAMLVGEPGQEKMQVIWSLCRNIKNKSTAPALLNKKPILLISGSIVATCKDKDSLENQIAKILSEVISAGNIILIIDNFTELLKHAESLGIDLINLTDPFLANTSIQIVALVNTSDFHQYFETNKIWTSRFENILVRPLSSREIIQIIYASALDSEVINKNFFTYQAIQELANSASYYFSGGVSSDKAMDLLNEIAPWAKRKNYKLIGKNEVLEYIEQKTNIPTSGKITVKEKDKLQNLETLIGKRVIGQKDAVLAVSNSLRRARTGVRNPNKPIGSFLFLGPTGVGKTETAKALAYVFFGSEDNMMRLDMSEYQTDDALDKLIGSFTSGKPGVLSNMIREKQYGVILLDEFEKTNKDVLNLFLQILDEGFFSDMSGQKINARNIMFIATSNAGAEKIFSMVSAGKNPKDATEEIIAEIVGKGLLKPELINRFDSTIIFRPLENTDLQQIAKIMLQKVSGRMVEKGLKLELSDTLVDYVVKNGSNKAFGARPMNRFIQDSIEGTVANLILKGEAIPGKVINFSVVENNLSTKVS